MPRPKPITFEQFVNENSTLLDRIVAKRCWKNREDARQEVLLCLWKKWPTIDWDKNPVALFSVIAKRACFNINDRSHRNHRDKDRNVEEAAMDWSMEDWALKEYTARSRAQKEPIPEFPEWFDELEELDRGMIRLAMATIDLLGSKRNYLDWMERLLPRSLQDDASGVIRRWYKRIDNLKSRMNGNREPDGSRWRWDKSSMFRRREKAILTRWQKDGRMDAVINDMSNGKLPPCNEKYATMEMRYWMLRLYALRARLDGPSHYTVPNAVPAWVWGDDKPERMRACLWMRRNWRHIESFVDHHGWPRSWDELTGVKKLEAKREWNKDNADRVKELREKRRPSVRAASMKYYWSHRTEQNLRKREWRARRRAQGLPT